jgi:hypothetical protein
VPTAGLGNRASDQAEPARRSQSLAHAAGRRRELLRRLWLPASGISKTLRLEGYTHRRERERRRPPARPLLPFLEQLDRRLPQKWDNKRKTYVRNDDWLLWNIQPNGTVERPHEAKRWSTNNLLHAFSARLAGRRAVQIGRHATSSGSRMRIGRSCADIAPSPRAARNQAKVGALPRSRP